MSGEERVSASRRAALSGVRAVSALLAAFFATVLVARTSSQEEFAAYAALLWMVGLLTVLPGMAFGQAATRDLATARGSGMAPGQVRAIGGHRLRQALVGFMFAGAVAAALSTTLPQRSTWSLATSAAFLAVAMGLSTVLTSINNGEERFGRAALPAMALAVASLTAVVTAGALGLRFETFLLMAGGLAALLLLVLAGPYVTAAAAPPRGFDSSRGFLLGVAALAGLNFIIWQRTEVYLLSVLGRPTDAAQYAAAVSISGGLVLGLGNAVVSILLPAFRRRAGDAKPEPAAIQLALDTVLPTVSAVAVGVAVAGPTLVLLAFGDGYRQAAVVVSPLAVAAAAAAVAGIAASASVAEGRLGPLLRTLTMAAFALLVADALGIWLAGLAGAVAANVLVQTACTGVLMRRLAAENDASLTTSMRAVIWLLLVAAVQLSLSIAEFATPAAAALGMCLAVLLAWLLKPITATMVMQVSGSGRPQVVGERRARLGRAVTATLERFAH